MLRNLQRHLSTGWDGQWPAIGDKKNKAPKSPEKPSQNFANVRLYPSIGSVPAKPSTTQKLLNPKDTLTQLTQARLITLRRIAITRTAPADLQFGQFPPTLSIKKSRVPSAQALEGICMWVYLPSETPLDGAPSHLVHLYLPYQLAELANDLETSHYTSTFFTGPYDDKTLLNATERCAALTHVYFIDSASITTEPHPEIIITVNGQFFSQLSAIGGHRADWSAKISTTLTAAKAQLLNSPSRRRATFEALTSQQRAYGTFTAAFGTQRRNIYTTPQCSKVTDCISRKSPYTPPST